MSGVCISKEDLYSLPGKSQIIIKNAELSNLWLRLSYEALEIRGGKQDVKRDHPEWPVIVGNTSLALQILPHW